ncbi:hypothetical protein U1Q18_002074 [Sarracenia purpurea var. burkii]
MEQALPGGGASFSIRIPWSTLDRSYRPSSTTRVDDGPMELWRQVDFGSTKMAIRIPRSGHLDRRYAFVVRTREAPLCGLIYFCQAYAISSRLKEDRSRRWDQELRCRQCYRRPPSSGKRDPSRRLRRL